MHYSFKPASGPVTALDIIEKSSGKPASEELAFCRVRGVELATSEDAWIWLIEGPEELKEATCRALENVLRDRVPHGSMLFKWMNKDNDSWIKAEWLDISSRISESCRINKGVLLACEPSWGGGVTVQAPSKATCESLRRKGVQKALEMIIGELTGERVEVEITQGLYRTTDYSPHFPAEEEQEQELERGEQQAGEERDVLLGSRIKIGVSEIRAISAPDDYVAVEGTPMAVEEYVNRRKERILSFLIADHTGAVYCKLASEAGWAPFSSNIRLKVAGRLAIDSSRSGQSEEPCLYVEDVETGCLKNEEHTRLCNRVELHSHTKMSALDSVCDTEELVQAARQMGMSAIAVTDHGVVHSFPQFYSAAVKNGIKPIFGMEGYLKEVGSDDVHHFTVLVKEDNGLANLYRLVSESHMEHFKRHPLVPRDLLSARREGLLLGSACAAGELFKLALAGAADSDLEKAMAFYDFVEVMPSSNSFFLVREGRLADEKAIRQVNIRLVNTAKKLGIPFVATGDVHFVRKQDGILRKVLLAGQDYKDFDEQPDLHLRSTEEMLDEFSYLGIRDAVNAVVVEPNRLALSADNIKPVPDGLFTPVLQGAEEDVRRMSEEQAALLYGTSLPPIVSQRLDKELRSVIGNGFASIYMVAMKLVRKSVSDGYLVGSRGSVGSSFVAYLLGITEVNPLPAHHRCPQCRKVDFGPFVAKHGFDLPDATCPTCGIMMAKDGHDIPFEVFLGFEGDKVPDIDLNFSGEYQPRIHKYCEDMFGRDNVFRAGTIASIAEKTAYGFVKAYEEHKGEKVGRAQAARLAIGTSGVRRTTGQHPGGIIVLPEGLDIHEFTPVQHPANSKEKGIVTTHFEYTALHDNLLKLDLLGHDDPTMIKMLEDLTKVSFTSIPFDDKQTMSIFSSVEALGLDKRRYGQEVGTIGIPEFGTRFVRGMLAETRPSTFDELVRISGLSHGTNVWLENAQEVIRSGAGALKDVISVRDDIMNFLTEKGMQPKAAFQVMEKVRKGKGLTRQDEESMQKLGLPEWYTGSCNKIKYMFPKAHACAYVMMAFRIAYAKVHMPNAFYSAYLTIRAADFDPSFTSMTAKDMDARVRSIEADRTSTQKDKDTVPVLELIREALLRGVKIKPIDIAASNPVNFVFDGEGVRAPLSSVPRLGSKIALKIAEKRQSAAFTSIDDLKIRTGLTKTHVDALRDAGAIASLRETDHMELF